MLYKLLINVYTRVSLTPRLTPVHTHTQPTKPNKNHPVGWCFFILIDNGLSSFLPLSAVPLKHVVDSGPLDTKLLTYLLHSHPQIAHLLHLPNYLGAHHLNSLFKCFSHILVYYHHTLWLSIQLSTPTDNLIFITHDIIQTCNRIMIIT